MNFSRNHTLLAPVALFAILILSGSFMWLASSQESAIMDELPHIPAGYSYARFLDYRLNPEHPPLLKALSAFPLLALPLTFPTESSYWMNDTNSQWDIGTLFLYESGNNADQILEYVRIFPILLTLLTIVLVYVWAHELLGNEWALLPAFLFGLSPTVLAHGHYVTTDIAATFGFLLATYAFVRFLNHPSRGRLITAGIALGIAELAKFSAVLLIPSFALFAACYVIGETIRKKHSGDPERLFPFFLSRALLRIGQLILIFLVALVVIYVVYFAVTLNYPVEKQGEDTQSILTSFSPAWGGNFITELAGHEATKPIAEYLLGIAMVLQRSSGGNTAYFLGSVSADGWWYYFPVVFLLKEPIPSLILIIIALFTGLAVLFGKSPFGMKRMRRLGEYLGIHFGEFVMLLTVLLYWLYSIRSTLNIGVRHLLPTLPFLYILTAIGLQHWIRGDGKKHISKIIGIILLACWFLGETIATYPHFLSYFNQIGGGTRQGYRYATDSNYDWGQDMKRLAAFSEEHAIPKIAVDYFGGGNAKYYLGGDIAEYWSSSKGDPRTKGIEWFAVSVNTLENAIAPVEKGFTRKPGDGYEWLTSLRPPKEGIGELPEPDYRVGTSIFVYHLE